ncbi:MAG: periplasmic heavy metal sensor [Rhodospirillaceae bacterium]|nr:periplasmic heavy metal sensor [Rhodospirillaceae bacterium]
MVTAVWTHARWVVIALALSVVLNLFLLGMTGGRHLHHWFGGSDQTAASWMQDEQVRPVRWLLFRLTEGLDRAERDSFLEAVGADREALVEAGGALMVQRRVALDLLRAEPVDRAAIDAAQDELRRRNDAFQAALLDAIADAAATLPPDARAKLGSGWE